METGQNQKIDLSLFSSTEVTEWSHFVHCISVSLLFILLSNTFILAGNLTLAYNGRNIKTIIFETSRCFTS